MKFSEKSSKFHLSTVKAWLLQCWPLLITKIPMENKSGMDSEVMRECWVAGCVQLCPALCDSGSRSPPGSASLGFSRQECWSGLPCPPSGELPDPGIWSHVSWSPALERGFFNTSATWEAWSHGYHLLSLNYICPTKTFVRNLFSRTYHKISSFSR